MAKKNHGSKQMNNDGIANIATGLGIPGADKNVTNSVCPDFKITAEQLDLLYVQDGITKSIVQVIPEQMLSKGFVVDGDSEGFVIAKLQELDGLQKIIEMLYWARLYGGGIIVLGLNDHRDLAEPVDLATLRSLDYMHVFDRYQINQGDILQIDKDMRSSNYGLPLYYNIKFYMGDGSFDEVVVHHSRILRVDGIVLPARIKASNKFWGESEIQACFTQLKSYLATSANIASLIHTCNIPVFGIKGLADSMNCETEENVQKRIRWANSFMSNLRMLVKDTEETFEKVSTNLSGMADILDRFMMAVSSVTRIPVSLLFGRSAAGMNSTGEHDTNAFYDHIIQQQSQKLKPVLEKLIRYIMLCKDGNFNGIEPENWSIVFNPLIENSPTEEANYRHRIAETDEKYINMGVLEPMEVRDSRFGSGVYSDITMLSNERELQEEYAATGNFEDRESILELYRKADEAEKARKADGKTKT